MLGEKIGVGEDAAGRNKSVTFFNTVGPKTDLLPFGNMVDGLNSD